MAAVVQEADSTVIEDDIVSLESVAQLQDPLPRYAYDHMPPLPLAHRYKQSPMYMYREHDLGRIREQSMAQTLNLQTNLKHLVSKTDATVVDFFRRSTTAVDSRLPVINYLRDVD